MLVRIIADADFFYLCRRRQIIIQPRIFGFEPLWLRFLFWLLVIVCCFEELWHMPLFQMLRDNASAFLCYVIFGRHPQIWRSKVFARWITMDSVLLTPEELDAHVANGTFRLSFVGMSNAGKSYRSKVLARDYNFLWYQVDEEIQKAFGFSDMGEISGWLGYPSDATYAEREARYLELENLFTKQAALETRGKNLVFDTTGSVIHLEPETIFILKENCLVINLDVGVGSLEKMVEKFFIEPKPVAWCGNFSKMEDESVDDALRRCYPALLRWRLGEYRTLAHITIPAEEIRDKTGVETLEVIKKYLT